jgi:hypothetical protein
LTLGTPDALNRLAAALDGACHDRPVAISATVNAIRVKARMHTEKQEDIGDSRMVGTTIFSTLGLPRGSDANLSRQACRGGKFIERIR